MEHIKNKLGKDFDVQVVQDTDKISFLVLDGENEIGHLVVSKKEKGEHLPVKDASINLSHRGTGLWKSLMLLAKDFVEKMGFAGLILTGNSEDLRAINLGSE